MIDITKKSLQQIQCPTNWNCERTITRQVMPAANYYSEAFTVESASSKMQMPIFGYAEFVAAMALLAVVYTITDLRYKFRARVAPIPLYQLTAVFSVVIGVGALVSNYWFSEELPIWHFLNSLALIQSILGAIFLILMCAWAFFVGMPAKYQRANCVAFARAVNVRIISGKKEELLMLADALGDTAQEIVRNAPTANERTQAMVVAPFLTDAQTFKTYTNDLLFMLASPRMTQAIAESSGIAAMRLFLEASKQEKRDINLSLFSRNLIDAMLKNKNSLLYAEQDIHEHGFLGHMQYFRKAIFGDYKLVEQQGSYIHSPLDAKGSIEDPYDAEQLEVYGQCFLITAQDYLRVNSHFPHSFTLYRFLSNLVDNIQHSGFNKYDGSIINPKAPLEKFRIASKIFAQLISMFDGAYARANYRPPLKQSLFIERIAGQVSSLIEAGLRLELEHSSTQWWLHYSMIWDTFFNNDNPGAVSLQIRRLVLRIFGTSIRQLEKYPNYSNTAIYAFSLNIANFSRSMSRKRERSERQTDAFLRGVMMWTRKHFTNVVENNPRALEKMLPSTISYDSYRGVLIRHYHEKLSGTDKHQTTEFKLLKRQKLIY
ncbi:hypothetical protein HBDW_41950 [Herbaspirillum sp. DW155]|uniref:hypothetical protein n=1 Tax=Herbaspirillum sp. DW155 TaxID=3095609 RepID=UPI00308AE390|nr:hypothetical protein HBDW_41950 [Herbaspirillum sp. DW155]